jgi:uncharacterized protein (DUF1330 family)
MSYYFIANIKINNPEEYTHYINDAEEIFNKFNGEYLAVDNHPEVLEGSWEYTRNVLIKFSSRADFDKWYNSDEYQKILRHRLKAASCDTVLVKGLDR